MQAFMFHGVRRRALAGALCFLGCGDDGAGDDGPTTSAGSMTIGDPSGSGDDDGPGTTMQAGSGSGSGASSDGGPADSSGPGDGPGSSGSGSGPGSGSGSDSGSGSGSDAASESTGTAACGMQDESCANGAPCCEGFTCCEGVPVPPGAEYCSSPEVSCPDSDRNLKEDLRPVDVDTVLDRVAALPITTWRYKTDAPNVRHLGPMAQDFRAAFEVGASERAIHKVDADGVALAAIQALARRVERAEQDNAKLQREVEELRARLGE